jgi:hypothetical protein
MIFVSAWITTQFFIDDQDQSPIGGNGKSCPLLAKEGQEIPAIYHPRSG